MTVHSLQKIGVTVACLVRYRKALLHGGKKYATLGATEHSNHQDSAGIFNKNILLYSFICGYFKC